MVKINMMKSLLNLPRLRKTGGLNIKGLIYIKDLLKADAHTTLRELIKPALFVPENNNHTSY